MHVRNGIHKNMSFSARELVLSLDIATSRIKYRHKEKGFVYSIRRISSACSSPPFWRLVQYVCMYVCINFLTEVGDASLSVNP